jgi:hypothetical protein
MHHHVAMQNMTVHSVSLIRAAKGWRIAVTDLDGGVTRGELPETPVTAPVEAAQREFTGYLRHCWGYTGELTWRRSGPDAWAAEGGSDRC